jgi:NAD(P)H-flavin reductase
MRGSPLAAPSEERTIAVLTARRDAGGGVNLVTLTPPIERAPGYRAPGQYIQVHAEGGGYFAFAGEVGAPSWELLVRNAGGASDALTNAPEGTTFDVSGPLGVGFPVERARGASLIVAVVGSALAVARPILRERIAERAFDATTLYLGVRTPKELPLASEVAGWGHAGIRLMLCLSRPDLDEPHLLAEAVRRHGYVQTVLAEDVVAGRVSGLVFAAGPPDMLEQIRQLATRQASGENSPTLEVWTNV